LFFIFNDVIACIDSNEQEQLDFDIPENLDMNNMLAEIAFKKGVTESHIKINNII
jgi:hypothetical protein